jgi:SAM-dependent methyltransferase
VAKTLRDAWETEARSWITWARKPGHDSYWRFHRDRFLRLLPRAPLGTLDVGCGEGRLPRDLKVRGYSVTAIDASATLIEHAHEADPEGDYRIADGASLPLPDGSVELVTAFMSLHDMDDLPGAINEAARVLTGNGHLCMAIVHPLNSAGAFESRTPDAPFVIRGSYFEDRRYADTVERDGLRMTFTSLHRPLQSYFDALETVGMAVERLVEVPDETDPPGYRWQRLPLFLHIRARRLYR